MVLEIFVMVRHVFCDLLKVPIVESQHGPFRFGKKSHLLQIIYQGTEKNSQKSQVPMTQPYKQVFLRIAVLGLKS